MPVPRPKPIQTLPSFVPTIASLDHLGEYLTWLMNERLPSVCLVMFCVAGLFVTYQLAVFMVGVAARDRLPHSVVPATRWPQPPGVPAGRAVVAAGDAAVEDVERQDERLRVAAPAAGHARVAAAAEPGSC